MKYCIITRGVPGCGKSEFTDFIKTISTEPAVECCTDDYWYDESGNYNFVPAKIGEAHAWNFERFKAEIAKETPVLIQSNTNVVSEHFEAYKALAEENGYMVFVLIVENRHGGVNSHSVPQAALDRMESSLRGDIKLQ